MARERLGRDDLVAVDRPLEQRDARRAPITGSVIDVPERSGTSIAYSRRSRPAARVRDTEAGEVEQVRALLADVGVVTDRRRVGASGIPTSWPTSAVAPGHVPHGKRTASPSHAVTTSPSWRTVQRKWW